MCDGVYGGEGLECGGEIVPMPAELVLDWGKLCDMPSGAGF
jgi:hypothetical protein